MARRFEQSNKRTTAVTPSQWWCKSTARPPVNDLL